MLSNVSAAFKNALEGDRLRFAWLIDLPENIRLTDYARDLQWNSSTYVSQGDVLSLPSIVREKGIKLQSYTIRLSNTDLGPGTPLDKLTSRNYTGTRCEVTLVLLGDDEVIIDGVSMYAGTFHTWQELETDTSSTMSITLTSPWSKPNLTAGRVTSNNNQTDLYEGDEFFKYAHRERENLGWGGKN